MSRLCIFLIFLSHFALGQSKLDSLRKELLGAKDDTNKTRLYYRLWQIYRNVDLEKASKTAEEGLAHAKKLKWDKGIAAFYTSKGEDFGNNRQLDSAEYYYKEAVKIYEKIDFPKGLAGALTNLSALYGNSSDFIRATEYGFKALYIAQEIRDTSYIVIATSNLSKYFYDHSDFGKAKEYANKAHKLANEAELGDQIGETLTMLAMCEAAEKDTLGSIEMYKKALQIYEEWELPIQEASTYANLSVLYSDYSKKIEYAKKARDMFLELDLEKYPVAISNYGNLAVNYFDLVRLNVKDISPFGTKERLNLAEENLKKCIRLLRETGDAGGLVHYLKLYGELEEYKGNYKGAIEFYKESFMLGDSLYSQEHKNRIAKLESEKSIEEKNREIEIQQLELSNAQRARAVLIGGAALLFVIGALLFYQNRMRAKSNAKLKALNQQLAEANQIKARFFGILSHDLRSPVASLIHFLQLQREVSDLTNSEHLHGIITESAENLLETMESVLLWSKSQMDHFVPQKREVRLSDLFSYIKKNLTSDRISFKQGHLEKMIADPDYLQVIMLNLSSNALKAVQKQEDGKVVWNALMEGDEVILSVKDNGPGMSEEQRATLFSKETVITAKKGLGLPIVRDLAEAIGCRIDVESKIGEGTEIFLYLKQ